MRLLAIVVLSLTLGLGGAWGVSIDPTTITILSSSSAAYGGIGIALPVGSGSATNGAEYIHINALDRDSGTDGRYLSDYASASLGVNTHLDFDFGRYIRFDQIVFTDRTSSGGSNFSNTRGTSDWVTSYQYIFSNDANFATNVATVVVKDRTEPTEGDSNLAHWQTTTIFGSPIVARYVRWDVVGTDGKNPGMADIDFSGTVVPEPGTYLLMGTVGLALVLLRRRSASAKS